jgi:hypothetical protein
MEDINDHMFASQNTSNASSHHGQLIYLSNAPTSAVCVSVERCSQDDDEMRPHTWDDSGSDNAVCCGLGG